MYISGWTFARRASSLLSLLFLPAAEARRLAEKHDDHENEDHRARCFGPENLGQTFQYADAEAAANRTDPGPHPADHDDSEDEDDDVLTHERADLIDRRSHHAGETRQCNAERVGQRHHSGDVDAEGLDHRRVFRRGAQIGAEARTLDDVPGAHAHHQRCDDDPAAIIRDVYEAEILAAAERRGYAVWLAGRAELDPQEALDHHGEADGEQQPIGVIEFVDVAYQQSLRQRADAEDDDRDEEQGPP